MICMIRESDYEIQYKPTDVSEISNKEKTFPKEWIINDNDIADNFLGYILPLISGEVSLNYENGMIKYLVRS